MTKHKCESFGNKVFASIVRGEILEDNRRAIDYAIYLTIITLALLFLFFGNRIATTGMIIDFSDYESTVVEAVVTEIISHEEAEEWWVGTTRIFESRITSSDYRNRVVTAEQSSGGRFASFDRYVREGDRVLLTLGDDQWHFLTFVRINTILILGAVFTVLLVVFGRVKGLNAILTLGFTCVAVFAVFIPSILSGKNIYLSSIIVCVYSIIVTLFLLYGVNKKSFAAVAGCFGGVIAAAFVTLFMSRIMELSGITDGDSIYLMMLSTENPIDLVAIVFAGIIIGAVGAIMDVAVSISSALWELKKRAPKLSFKGIFRSGMNIGKDIMGSMTNTLVLAYIGSSLSVILLMVVYVTSFTELFNMELVIVELLQAIVGIIGIFLTIPLTALMCAVLFSNKRKRSS